MLRQLPRSRPPPRPQVTSDRESGWCSPAAAPRARHMWASSRCSRNCMFPSTALRAPAWARWSEPVTHPASPAQEMTTFLLGVDWKTVVGGLGQRSLEPIEQKRQGVTYSNRWTSASWTATWSCRRAWSIPAASRICCAALSPRHARSRTSTSCRFRFAPSRRTWSRANGGAGSRGSRHGDAGQHGDPRARLPRSSSITCARGWRTGAQHSGGRCRNLCADIVIVVNLVEPRRRPRTCAARPAAWANHGRHDRGQRGTVTAVHPARGRAH